MWNTAPLAQRFPAMTWRLVDDGGADVPVGGIGELLVRGNSSAADYWNQREKSRTTFEGEWTRTGDKYELSPKWTLYLLRSHG